MEKGGFETFMRDSEKEMNWKDLKFSPNVKPWFQSWSFDAGKYVVFGAVSEMHTILIFDRRNAPYLTPKSREEMITSLLAQIPKWETVLIPVERSYSGEFIGHGLAEMIPNEIMGIFISSGPVAQQLNDEFNKGNDIS